MPRGARGRERAGGALRRLLPAPVLQTHRSGRSCAHALSASISSEDRGRDPRGLARLRRSALPRVARGALDRRVPRPDRGPVRASSGAEVLQDRGPRGSGLRSHPLARGRRAGKGLPEPTPRLSARARPRHRQGEANTRRRSVPASLAGPTRKGPAGRIHTQGTSRPPGFSRMPASRSDRAFGMARSRLPQGKRSGLASFAGLRGLLPRDRTGTRCRSPWISRGPVRRIVRSLVAGPDSVAPAARPGSSRGSASRT